jgi:hypothetical protein
MTLKEQFKKEIIAAPVMDEVIDYWVSELEQTADEFAIGFLKFVNKNYIYRKGHYHMKGDFEKSMNINQQQLLEIYKKEKGL